MRRRRFNNHGEAGLEVIIAVIVIIIILAITPLLLTAFNNAGQNLPNVLNTTQQSASYIIYQDGDMITAKNGTSGRIDFRGTNASSVIQGAIDSVFTGAIVFMPGTYDLVAWQTTWLPYGERAALQVKNCSGVSLIGSGLESTIFRMADDQNKVGHLAIMLDLLNADRFKVSGITFDGNRDNQELKYVDGNGLILSGGIRTNCVYENLEIKNSFGSGIYLGNNRGLIAPRSTEEFALVQNIRFLNNYAQDLCCDNTNNTIYNNLFIQRDPSGSSHTGLSIFGSITNWQTRHDNNIFNNLNLENAGVAISYVSGISITGLRIMNMDYTSWSGAVHVYSSKDIVLNIDSIERETTTGYGIFASIANVDIFGGYISAKTGVDSANLGNVTVHNTIIKATYIALYTEPNGKLFASGVKLTGKATYMWDVSANSTMQLTGLYAENRTSAYKSTVNAILISSGMINCGLENSGVAIIRNGMQYIDVPFGLSAKPSIVLVTGTTYYTDSLHVWDIDIDSFVIYSDTTVPVDTPVYWFAKV